MKDLRDQIDDIDEQLLHLLARRMDLVKEIGKMKNKAGQPIEDGEREAVLRKHLTELAKKEKLSDGFVNHLYTHIFIESKRIQGKSE